MARYTWLRRPLHFPSFYPNIFLDGRSYQTPQEKTMKMCRCTGTWWDSPSPVFNLNCNIPWFSNILIQHALLTIISRTSENNIWGEQSQWSRQVVFFQLHKGDLCRSVQKLWIKKEGRRGGMKLTHAFWPLAQNPRKIVKPDRQPVSCSLCWLDCWFSQLCFVFLNQDLFGKFTRINSQVLF